MTLHPLSLADDAVRRERLFVATVCLAGAALLGVSAFVEIVAAGEQGSEKLSSVPTLSPLEVLPTVPQAFEVLPTATRPEPEIATHGG